MLKIQLSREGNLELGKLIRDTKTLRGRLLNPKVPLYKIKSNMVGTWKTNFKKEGGMYGEWASLAEMTQANRIQGGYHPRNPILVREGTLRNALYEIYENGSVSSKAIQWNFFSNQAPWILTHQFGMLWGGVIVPPRPMFGLELKDRHMAEDVLEEYIDSVIGRYYT